ncbi:hypothetical protein H312_00863 [Anncaliia algerae PRA339]|uniref:Uncharacterized protein n=1 Tax=Anncaliia algerae PRA339 TaxID=1288291 RepID=A0A059F3A8_9MICR|nr:hypothetical protein H312_00863 [Anncaliia algerae PRA339]
MHYFIFLIYLCQCWCSKETAFKESEVFENYNIDDMKADLKGLFENSEREWSVYFEIKHKDRLRTFVFTDIHKWIEARECLLMLQEMMDIFNYLENNEEGLAVALYNAIRKELKLCAGLLNQLGDDLDKESIDGIIEEKLSKIEELSDKQFNGLVHI